MKSLLNRLDNKSDATLYYASHYHLQNRLLYIVNHCFPFSSNGYAIRTHGVSTGLVSSGCEVFAASRPGAPWDQSDFTTQNFSLSHVLDGVNYIHTREPSEAGLSLEKHLSRSVESLSEIIRVFKPSAVMAASNWRNAIPAAIAARELGFPFFYEVRGFWEISKSARDSVWAKSNEFACEVAYETAVARSAQRVFTINRFMIDELVRRGIDPSRIDLVPNGFPGWPALPRGGPTRSSLGILSCHLVGYVGSFNGYEGIEDLIVAIAQLRGKSIDVAVLLVGSSEPLGMDIIDDKRCPECRKYRELAERLGVNQHLYIVDRVKPEQVASYYALMDVVVIPRRPLAVCEIVSPIKPLEAAVHGKRVLLSDVAPLADLANLCPNFNFFKKGNIASLVQTLGDLLSDGDFSPARCDSLEKLTWDINVMPIVDALNSLSGKFLIPKSQASHMSNIKIPLWPAK